MYNNKLRQFIRPAPRFPLKGQCAPKMNILLSLAHVALKWHMRKCFHLCHYYILILLRIFALFYEWHTWNRRKSIYCTCAHARAVFHFITF